MSLDIVAAGTRSTDLALHFGSGDESFTDLTLYASIGSSLDPRGFYAVVDQITAGAEVLAEPVPGFVAL